MEVWHITDCLRGGVQTHLEILVPRLKGHQRILVLGHESRSELSGVELVSIPRFRRNPLTWRGAIRSLRVMVPDNAVVYAHSTFAGWMCSLAFRNRKFIYAPHAHFGIIPTRGPKRIAQRVLERFESRIMSADVVFACVSQDEVDVVRRLHQSNDYALIHHAVEPSTADLTQPRKWDFLFLGRLDSQKRPEFMLGLAQAFPEARIAIAGSGPMRAALERKAAKIGATNVQFLGFVEDSRACMRNARVFVMTSSYEAGVPYTVLEALAEGCQVIVPDAPGLRDAVTRGLASFWDPQQPSAVAEILRGPAPDGRREQLDDVVRRHQELIERIHARLTP